MSRHRGRWHNPPYQPSTPAGYLDPDPAPDPDATVPVSDVQQEAIIALANADETTKKMFDHPLGKVFLAVCAVFAILIVASLGICILSKIWLEIFT
jgi:hypothetical protein